MKHILFITKQEKERTLSTDDVIRLFEQSDNLNDIKSAVERAEDRIYSTWASVDIKDNAGELIPIQDVIAQQDILLERNGPISDEHTNKIIGETIAYKVLEHPKTKSLGVMHLNRIFNHNDIDDTVWSEIVSGERTGSSVGGYNKNLSFGKDKTTGEDVKILEGFNQFETASVYKPCNPLALNESFSVVAKSNISKVSVKPDGTGPHGRGDGPGQGRADGTGLENVNKPFAGYKNFDSCVAQNQDKENPKAYCATIMRQVEGKKEETDINKNDYINTDNQINKLEGDTMSEDVLKAISDLNANVAKLSEDVAGLKKQEVPEEEEKKPKEEEKPKAPEEDKKQDEEEKKPEEEKEIEKEDAKGDIEGEGTDKPPEDPSSEDSNDQAAFKKMESMVSKKFDEMKNLLVTKTQTPRIGTAKDVKKADTFSKLPLDLALGTKKMSYIEVNKSYEEHLDNVQGGRL